MADRAGKKLDGMLAAAGLVKRASYRPGEVQSLLGISERQFWYLTERFEADPDTGLPCRPDALDSYLMRCQRRVRYDELVAFIDRNNTYERRHGVDPRQMTLFG
ncbi:MAG: DNA-binding protein [Deltaproteobacteria bacterium]|nr:DNA-binding protein [Deltaproteobacteria bacterium]